MAELDGKQVGTQQMDAVNKTGHQNTQSHNLFDLSHYNALSARFGDLTPFLAKEVVPGDRVQFGSNHELRTLTLASPVLSPVRMHKDYFFVPMKSMLPHWDKLISDSLADLIGEGNVYSWLPRVNIYKIYEAFADLCYQRFMDFCRTSNPLDMDELTGSDVQLFCMVRNLFSSGSLLRLLQYPAVPINNRTSYNVETFFNDFFEQLLNLDNWSEVDPETHQPIYTYGFKFMVTGENFPTMEINSGSTLHGSGDSISRMLDMLENINFLNEEITFVNYSDTLPFPEKIKKSLRVLADQLYAIKVICNTLANKTYEQAPDCYVNLCKLVAYHAVAVQFFTNDKVDDLTSVSDFIYTYFNSYGQYIHDDGVSTRTSGPTSQALYNMLGGITYTGWTSQEEGTKQYTLMTFFAFLRLFCFDASLKYGDYFMGARPKPIAVGDVEITVNNDVVQALDVTRNLAIQRLLNAVNKLGSSLSQYSKGIFGEAPKFVDATPQFLARSTTYIGNPETTNTADEQGKITSQFRSVDGKFEFSAQFEDFGYIIGIVSFDALPCYPSRVDRDCFHTDFYTFFNPMLQNIGDQPVNLGELTNLSYSLNTPFAYQQRFAEYKSMASYCTGLFAGSVMRGRSEHKADYYGIESWLYQTPDVEQSINPYVIRQHRFDFDRFYSALDGVAFGTYAHFAIIFNNDLKINRKMQFQSTIL